MRVILKYELAITDVQSICMPKVASPLSVAEQKGQLTLWVSVDPGTPDSMHRFRIAGTGRPIHDDGDWLFLGTVLMSNGLVWHVHSELSPALKRLVAEGTHKEEA